MELLPPGLVLRSETSSSSFSIRAFDVNPVTILERWKSGSKRCHFPLSSTCWASPGSSSFPEVRNSKTSQLR